MEIELLKGWGLPNKATAGIKALEQIKQTQGCPQSWFTKLSH